MNKPLKYVLFAIIIFLIAFGSYELGKQGRGVESAPELVSEEAEPITGTIISLGGNVITLQIPGMESGHDVTITDNTAITDSDQTPLQLGDLLEGDSVTVDYDGPVSEAVSGFEAATIIKL